LVLVVLVELPDLPPRHRLVPLVVILFLDLLHPLAEEVVVHLTLRPNLVDLVVVLQKTTALKMVELAQLIKDLLVVILQLVAATVVVVVVPVQQAHQS
jgi:hypothetical protein